MNKHIHFIGIGGIGMSGIAQLYLEKGVVVSGSDLKMSPITEKLISQGAKIYIGHSPANINGADTVIYSSAIKDDNPEFIEVAKRNITVLKRAEALAGLMQEKVAITISGAHGKTTTTSMISSLLEEAGLAPTVASGGIVRNFKTNAWSGSGKYFVAEADESDGSFLYYQPTYSVITNIDREHLDYYHEFDYIKEAFRDFMLKTKDNGIIFYNGDDHNLKDIKRQIDKRGLSFGLSKYNDVYPRGVKLKGFSSEFNCIHKGKNLGQFCLNIPGLHNISNSLVVIALGLELGLAPDTIRKSLGSYRGTQRRLEVKLDFNDIKVIDDYAHHPTEIKATLEAVRSLKHNRLLVIFQPHRYSRLKFLFDEFVKVLTNSEHLILSDLYPASEPPIPGITSENLAFKIRDCGHPDVRFVPKSNLCDCILRQVGAGDIVLFMGAGDIGHTADELARRIKRVTKGKISFGEPLKSRCTFKIGGTAKVWVEPKDKEDLKIILRFFTKIGMPVFVIGGGSNILFNDGLIEGIIIHLGSCYFRRIIFKGDLVKAGSGVSLAKLIQKAKEENLGGCEHLFGIPGTVGGALSMNAGISLNSCQLDIGSLVSEVEVMDYNGNIHILEKEDLKFDYRSSNLNRFVIVSATLRLKKSSPLEITSEISRIKDMRAASHGYPKASAGCIFKNPKRGLSAGFLIERCGLKGARVGDAQISSSHANFILNVGNARASNVINLMALTRRLVKKRFNLDLEQEVRIVG